MDTQIQNMGTDGREVREIVPLGVIGAIIGVLLGTILWVVISQVGFIAGIAGYAIVYCGMKGYHILGRKLSKGGIVIFIILSLLAIFGAEMISLAISAYTELHVSIGEAFGLIPDLMGEPELVGIVVKDLAVGYILSIWASYSSIKSVWKETGR